MKPRACRQKGVRGEDEAAVILGHWYYNNPLALCRTHGSRGRKGFKDQKGDIGIAKSELPYPWAFCVEVKFQEGWNLDSLVYQGPTSKVVEYWNQCLDATPPKKIPMLMMKKKYHPWIIGLKASHVYLYHMHVRAFEITSVVYTPLDLMLFDVEILLVETLAEGWRTVRRLLNAQ